MVESAMAETNYTHHQKTVIADAEIVDSDKRRLVGYIGGIDLTDGRWDTPEFPLFDFAVTHGSDFYQGCTMGATAETGPRQPWQDIHAKIEGPAVLDILKNFTERWSKQAGDKIGHLVDITEEEYELEVDEYQAQSRNVEDEYLLKSQLGIDKEYYSQRLTCGMYIC